MYLLYYGTLGWGWGGGGRSDDGCIIAIARGSILLYIIDNSAGISPIRQQLKEISVPYTLVICQP